MNPIASASRLLLFSIFFVFVSNLPAYLLAMRGGIVPWHTWILSIVACAVVATVYHKKLFSLSVLSLRYISWFGAFILVCLLSLMLIDNSEVAIEQFIVYGWNFGIGCSLLLLARERMQVRACGLGVVAAVLLLAVLTIMEFADPGFQVLVDRQFDDLFAEGQIGRAGALYGNPNNNGAAMVLGMFIGQFFIPKALRFPFMLIVGAAVFCTVSRSSLTLWGFAVLLSFVFGFNSRAGILPKLTGLVMVGGLAYLLLSGQIPPLLVSLGLDQLMNQDMLERLSGNFFTQDDGSSVSRVEAAVGALKMFADHPILGGGLGASNDIEGVGIGAHNQHLKIASETGAMGYIVWAAMLMLAVFSGSVAATCFVLLYLFVSLFSHTMFTYAAYGVLLPFSVALLPAYLRGVDTGRKKRRRRRKSRSIGRTESTIEV